MKTGRCERKGGEHAGPPLPPLRPSLALRASLAFAHIAKCSHNLISSAKKSNFSTKTNLSACGNPFIHITRFFAPRRKGFHWTPEGHCGCLVDFLSTTPNSMIFKITPGTCVLKTNFYTHKKKSHVPALILKFLTTTPNLTSNFET